MNKKRCWLFFHDYRLIYDGYVSSRFICNKCGKTIYAENM